MSERAFDVVARIAVQAGADEAAAGMIADATLAALDDEGYRLVGDEVPPDVLRTLIRDDLVAGGWTPNDAQRVAERLSPGAGGPRKLRAFFAEPAS